MGQWSRNRNFGLALSEGAKPDEVVLSQKTVVEGYSATACFFEKCRDLGVEMPILKEIHSILYAGKDPARAISDLMSRDLKAESVPE